MSRHGITRALRSPASDPQRAQVYRMEKELNGGAKHHVMEESRLERLSRSVCRYYGIPPIKIFMYNKPKERVYGWTSEDEIHLNQGFGGANALTLLHELAHCVVDERFEHAEAHGPEWVSVYMHLLYKYKVLPMDAFQVMARRWNIRMAPEFLPGALKGVRMGE